MGHGARKPTTHGGVLAALRAPGNALASVKPDVVVRPNKPDVESVSRRHLTDRLRFTFSPSYFALIATDERTLT